MVSGKRLVYSVQCLGFSVKCQVLRVTMLSTAARSTMVWLLSTVGALFWVRVRVSVRVRVRVGFVLSPALRRARQPRGGCAEGQG